LKTIYDLVTMIIFAGIVVLFLQRSTAEEPKDHMYQYLPPCVGCAVANYAGNHGLDDHTGGGQLCALCAQAVQSEPMKVSRTPSRIDRAAGDHASNVQ
jgi:hypothetical protein